MIDTTPTAVARFDLEQPVCHMGSAFMQSEPYGDYVRYSDYAALADEYHVLRTEKHADAEAIGALREERDALASQLEASNQRAVNACYDRADKLSTMGIQYECCAATANNCADDILSIHADTPAKVTVQEASKVLLGDDFTSPLLEVLDVYNIDCDVGQDVLQALRAIAGGDGSRRQDWQPLRFMPAAKVTVQEASKVLLGDDFTSPRAKALVEALRECEAEIDQYIRQEYPYDHPVQERYRQRDFSANPARIALAQLKDTK